MATSGKSRDSQIQFLQEGVFIHTTVARVDEDALVAGRIHIVRKQEGVFIEWKPADEYDADQGGCGEWAMVDAVGYKKEKTSDKGTVTPLHKVKKVEKHKYIINFDITDLKSFKRSKPSLGWSYIIFILKCGTTFPALHFHQGGTKALIKEMEKFLIVKRSASDTCLYLVKEHDPAALSKSFDELDLFGEQGGDIVTRFITDPYNTTWGGFSKVTKFLHASLVAPDAKGKLEDKDEVAEILATEDVPGVNVNNHDEPGFEMVTKGIDLPERPEVKRAHPLTPQEWAKSMDKDGKVLDCSALKEKIFRGGVDPTLRIEVWKFLLGYYTWDSTHQSRQEQRKKKVDEYFRMKLQWKSFSDAQENRFALLKEKKSLIDKDVTRTDRTHPFFAGDKNTNIQVLYDILMTYCMYHFDLGYVQGMSDLLAPILVIMENEVDAFWCFAGFMEEVHHNFEMDQAGMKRQLNEVGTIIRILDSQLWNYLESHDSGNMYFCFRWLLIMFKREFSFPDIMRLWEVMWTKLPGKNFHLLFCLAILDTEKNTLIENNFGFTEILKRVNDMSGTIDLEDALKKAEGMYLQVRQCKNLPPQIQELFDLDQSHLTLNGGAISSSSIVSSQVKQSFHIPTSNTVEHLNGAQPDGNGTAVTTPDDSSIEILPEQTELNVL